MFSNKVNEYVTEYKPDQLILHTGTHHIHGKFAGKNLTTRQMEAYRHEISVAALNVFNTAINAINLHKSVKKVIIMKLPVNRDDPSTLKSDLSHLFNDTLRELCNQSPHKKNIILGRSSFLKSEVTKTVTKLINESAYAIAKPSDKTVIPTYNRFEIMLCIISGIL